MKTLLSFFAISAIFIFCACSDSTAPDTQANIRIRSVLSEDIIQIIKLDDNFNNPQKTEVDSVRIQKISILIKEIKFHSDGEADENKDQLLKAGPFIFVGDETGTYFEVAGGQIPSGLYNKVKFEIHRFNTADQVRYNNDITFHEFATTERYSMIVEGLAYKFGTAYGFTYFGTPTFNLSLKFEPSVEIKSNETNDIYLQINQNNLLKIGDTVLDPRDKANEADIDYLIKTAIKAIKKHN